MSYDTLIVCIMFQQSMCRHKPASALHLENESLKDVLDQHRRSLKTLDEEINLHRLNQAEHDKRISAEKL